MGMRRAGGRGRGGALEALKLLSSEDKRVTSVVMLFLWVRYWYLLAPAFLLMFLWRFASGRVLLRTRRTDATWLCRARAVQGGWWAERAGWVRQAARLAPLAAPIAWSSWSPLGTVLLGAAGVALAAWWGVRRRREWVHERTWLRPMWPAIARVLGEDAQGAPPRSWVELSSDPRADDAEIVVALPIATGDDRPMVAALATIFEQRIGVGRWVPEIEHADRLVTFRRRPADPQVWPAVASVLRLGPEELSRDWLTLPADPAAEDARIVVQLPAGLPDDRKVVDQLREVVNVRFPGSWTTRTALTDRVVALVHTRPAPEPPRTAPAEEQAAFLARFGTALPDPADLEGLLTGLVDVEPVATGGPLTDDSDEQDVEDAA